MASISVYQNYNNQNMGFFGYSKGNTTHGYYNVTFNYDSATRSGNTITVKNAYVKMANPNSGYTTNYVGVTNVVVGGVDLGISVKQSGGTSYHTCQTGTKSSFTFTVSGVSTNTATISVRMCFYAASNTSYEKPDRVQTLTGTLSFGYGTMTVTFSGNGGNTPSPSTKTVTYGGTYGTLPTCSRPNANNYSYSLKGWYTASSGGSQITSSTTVTSTGNHTIYAQWNSTLLTSACGVPTIRTSTYSDYVYVSCTAGTNGTGNAVTGVEVFATVDGTTPSTTNYQFHKTLSCSAGKSSGFSVNIYMWSSETLATYSGTLKIKARTIGDAGSAYYSALSDMHSVAYNIPTMSDIRPTFISPSTANLVCGCDDDFIDIIWEDSYTSNSLIEYEVYLIDNVTGEWCYFDYADGPDRFISIPCSILDLGHVYTVAIDRYDYGTDEWSGYVHSRGFIEARDIGQLPSPSVQVSTAGIIPGIKPDWRQNTARMLYINEGMGNVCKLSWNTPAILDDNRIGGYELHINMYVPNTSSYIPVFSKNIGDVNEFYVTAELMTNAIEAIRMLGNITSDVFEVSVKLIAKSAYGSAYDSLEFESARFYVVNGHCLYTTVGKHSDGTPLKRKVLTFQNRSGAWQPVIDIFKKTDIGDWKQGAPGYDLVTTASGDPVIDPDTDTFIYSL
jgi:hypothetical protein